MEKLIEQVLTDAGRNLKTGDIYRRKYEEAKEVWPKAGRAAWHWYAEGAVQDAENGYASVAS